MRGQDGNRQPKIRLSAALLVAVAAIFSACADKRLPELTLQGDTMGTRYSVLLVDPVDELQLDDLRAKLQQRLDEINAIASTYGTASELSQFNLNASTEAISVSAELCAMISSALQVSQDTGGAFDITVGSLVNLWGFGPDLRTNSPPSMDELQRAHAGTGFQNIEANCNTGTLRKSNSNIKVDLSGWAKGYATDQLARLLADAGQHNYLVEIGGEIRVQGVNAERMPFAIALESPTFASHTAPVIINLSNIGIATSGNYRNFFDHDGTSYSHAIDPRTGQAVTHPLLAITVVHPSTAYADAIATALLVLGSSDGLVLANQLDIAAYFAISNSTGTDYIASDAFLAGEYLSQSDGR